MFISYSLNFVPNYGNSMLISMEFRLPFTCKYLIQIIIHIEMNLYRETTVDEGIMR